MAVFTDNIQVPLCANEVKVYSNDQKKIKNQYLLIVSLMIQNKVR